MNTAVPELQTARATHLVICANPSSTSFDSAIVDAYSVAVRECGHQAVVRDLYALGFDPVLKDDERPGHAGWAPRADVAEELGHVRDADVIVLVYPIWYGLPPAILKGYIDRVLGANYSFRAVHDRRGQPGLAGKPLLSFSTSGLPLDWLSERGQVLSLREILDVYLWRGFGMKQSEHVMIESVVPNMSTAYATAQLDRVRHTAARTCAMVDDSLLVEVDES
jgi:NAD(P)H dehydrogenase (quinone)